MEIIHTFAFLQNLSMPEIIVILFIFILLFGAKKLPELARGVGKSIKEFKKATSTIEDDLRNAMDEEPEVKKPIETENKAESQEKTPSSS